MHEKEKEKGEKTEKGDGDNTQKTFPSSWVMHRRRLQKTKRSQEISLEKRQKRRGKKERGFKQAQLII